MGVYVVLLRGINVGGKARVPMPALRETLAGLGLEDVVTYIQSGNAIVRAPKADDRSRLTRRIADAVASGFGVPAKVILRTPAELAEVEAANPFDHADRSKVHVVFLSKAPTAAAVARLDPDRSPPDEFAVHGKEVYLHLPNGAGRTKLTIDYFERGLGAVATHRNWNTLLKLIELGRAAA